MANRSLAKGPILPLAVMAMFALMIPVFSIANSSQKAENASAMRVKQPYMTPNVPPVEVPYGWGQKPSATPYGWNQKMSPKPTPIIVTPDRY